MSGEPGPRAENAVLFLVFNRPEPTRAVFDAIRRARPRRLYVAADGPRAGRPGEAQRCGEVRDIVSEGVDWPCEVTTLFRDENLGCGQAVSSAITWFFSQEEQGIILEDDCLPDPSFFRFCDELLARFRDDRRVMSVSGTNYAPARARTSRYSYRFSRYSLMWGWATWRRAWALNDYDMTQWPRLRGTGWLREVGDGAWMFELVWRDLLDRTHRGEIDTWDYQWIYSCWLQGAFSLIPDVNLVSNIGFGDGATHTPSGEDPRAGLPSTSITFPLRHPPFVNRRPTDDAYLDRHWFHITPRAAARLLDQRHLGGRAQRGWRMLRGLLRPGG